MSYLQVACVGLSLVLVACKGEVTRKAVAKQYAPKMAALRAKLDKVAAVVDTQGPTLEPIKVDPPLVYDSSESAQWRGNTDFIPYEALRTDKPMSEIESIAPLSQLWLALSIVGQPLEPSINEEHYALRDELFYKHSLALRYIVVVKTKIEEPRVIDASTYDAGRVIGEALVVDMEKLRVIASASALSIGPDETTVTVEASDSKALENHRVMQKLPEKLRSEMMADARKQLFDSLEAAGLTLVNKAN